MWDFIHLLCIVFVSIFHDEFVSFFLLNSVYSSNGFMMLYVLCRKKMSKELQFLDSFFVVVEFFLAIWICIKPYISLIALMNMCQECFASIVNVSVNKNMSKNIKIFGTFTKIKMVTHLYKFVPVFVLNFLLDIYQVSCRNVSF